MLVLIDSVGVRVMSKAVGRSLAISPFRQNVIELMALSAAVPSVCADRRMDLNSIVAARLACHPRPSWCGLFAKAYGILGRDYPELRRSYVKFPVPRLYEHPHNIASLNVEREDHGERIVLYCLIRSPENRSLREIDDIIRRHKEEPLESLRSYVRSSRVGRIPWPARRIFWWLSLNVFGRRRCHNFGTFGISSVGAQGAGLLHLTPILTSTLHFGMFDELNRMDVRLAWDHRVMDGGQIARILRDLEDVLNRDIARELTGAARIAA